MLSQQEIDEYNENGYILARNVVSKEQLTELQRLTYEFIENSKDIPSFNSIKNTIFVKSKQDITNKIFDNNGYYNISSKNNYGIKNLLNLIKNKIHEKTPNEKIYISRERHVVCLTNTINYLEATKKEKNVDLFAEDIRLAIKSLSSLFGSVDIEEILDIIFSDFCIGK